MQICEASRKLYDQLARGWNTWDVQSVAAHVLLPEKIRLHISVVVPARNGYTENSLWDHVENFGEHSDDGRYTSVDLCYLERRFRVESSARGDELLLRVTPLNVLEGTYIALEAAEIWGGRPRIAYEGEGIAVSAGEKTLCVRALNPQKTLDWDPVKAAHLTVSGTETVYFVVNSDKSPAEIDRAIEDAQAEWLNETIRADGALGEGITAMRRSLLWNMVYEPRHARVVTPVSRNWCRRRGVHFGDYVLFDWDTFFAAIQYALISKELAYSTFFSILEELTPEGMVPNFGCATGQSRDRSEPQVGALCAWRLYQQFKDDWFIASVFEPLLTWNRWRFRERDKNHDGLMELGSTKFSGTYDELKADGFGAGTKQGAMWESGLDNSTMFDRAVFNEELECLEQSYVGLNGLMLADCDLLARMARLLGREAEEKELTARYDDLTAKIDAELWSEEAGTYLNKGWDGAFDPTLSLTHFYPMLGGRVSPARQKKLMDHLLDENEFWGKYVVPNIARSDASFPEQEYWRGRIWAPTNFLVGEGLLRMGETETWDEVTRRGLEMFLDCWQKKGIVGENYNAITGEAAENGSSDRFYHWGALFAYMAIQRAVNFNEWTEKVEIRPLPEWLDNIYNIPVGAEKIDAVK